MAVCCTCIVVALNLLILNYDCVLEVILLNVQPPYIELLAAVTTNWA